MPIKFSNNASTVLASAIAAGATSLAVTNGTGVRFPVLSTSDYFYATLSNTAGLLEIIKVTAVSGDTFTVVRAQEGTSELAWAAGDKVELRITAGGLVDLVSDKLDSGSAQTVTNKTFGSYTEAVFAVSGTTPVISPNNGPIQVWTLTGAATPTVGVWNEGQSITLMVDDGAGYAIDWSSLVTSWETGKGSAPTLSTTGMTPIVLWKVGTIIYGARVGDA